MKKLLKLTDLAVSYGHSVALDGINMYINESEAVSLIGANGAGKTTTLKAISGIVRPIRGKIELDGQDITRMPSHKIVSSGIIQVPEGRQIFADLTVTENIEMGASLRKDTANVKKEIEEIYDRFPRLRERAGQLGGTMSGGEQQMLAIARGLIAKPRILMLDEPSLGLAPLVIKEIMDYIQQLKDDGITILLIEQNANLALKITDRTYVLENGRIIKEGRSNDLLHDSVIRKAYLGG